MARKIPNLHTHTVLLSKHVKMPQNFEKRVHFVSLQDTASIWLLATAAAAKTVAPHHRESTKSSGVTGDLLVVTCWLHLPLSTWRNIQWMHFLLISVSILTLSLCLGDKLINNTYQFFLCQKQYFQDIFFYFILSPDTQPLP